MSELTSCNYCDLKRLKLRVKKDKNKIVLKPAKGGGIDVYEKTKNNEEYFLCWFMELTDHCVC